MNTVESQQQIIQLLRRLSPENLAFVTEMVNFLIYKQNQEMKSVQANSSDTPLTETQNGTDVSHTKLGSSTLGDLLELAGTWEGDDIQECLQLVHESRASLEF
ncbi:DUF2281 domain-containing protein [Scytonema sp. UIC 10036]|uniref:DUF2281 domain-containing protein n=1 Tax=Scytonema sp. UIC 10036 TaxID=2304196 RepID=UPI001FAA2D76|nr:DUF2281 domain-containing protein [Scytonema sp. UIC 10036]